MLEHYFVLDHSSHTHTTSPNAHYYTCPATSHVFPCFVVRTQLYSALPPVAELHGHANPVAASDGARPHEDITSGRSTALLGYCLPPPFSRSNLSVGIQVGGAGVVGGVMGEREVGLVW